MTKMIEVDITKIDEKIAKAQEEFAKAEATLAALKMARSWIAEQGENSTDSHDQEISPTNESSNDDWYASLPGLFAKGSLTTKQICDGLLELGHDVSYGSVYQWMKRAVSRGDYTKRGKKYKPIVGGAS